MKWLGVMAAAAIGCKGGPKAVTVDEMFAMAGTTEAKVVASLQGTWIVDGKIWDVHDRDIAIVEADKTDKLKLRFLSPCSVALIPIARRSGGWDVYNVMEQPSGLIVGRGNYGEVGFVGAKTWVLCGTDPYVYDVDGDRCTRMRETGADDKGEPLGWDLVKVSCERNGTSLVIHNDVLEQMPVDEVYVASGAVATGRDAKLAPAKRAKDLADAKAMLASGR
jgi:hypothetical protein